MARHGETVFNVEKRLQGRLDVPLSDVGRRQALRLAEYLHQNSRRLMAGGMLRRIVSSPQRRAMDTARAVADAFGMEVVTDDRLVEIDVGGFAGLTWPEARETAPDFFAALQADAVYTRYPGGESLADVYRRASSFLDEAEAGLADGATVLVVAHAVVLKCMLCRALRVEVGRCRRIALGNASVSSLSIDGGVAVVDFINDTHFLEEAMAEWAPAPGA